MFDRATITLGIGPHSSLGYSDSTLLRHCFQLLPHAVICESLCFWRRQSVFLFVYEIYREPLNGFAPNSHGIRVWF